ncbi:hypothetical protein KAH81_08700 [bacterium]|nr:hypothetical protein [bacterium]
MPEKKTKPIKKNQSFSAEKIIVSIANTGIMFALALLISHLHQTGKYYLAMIIIMFIATVLIISICIVERLTTRSDISV